MSKLISIEKAEKILSKYSPMLLIAKELKLKFLILEDSQITGPAVGLTVLVDKLTKKLPIKNMLDLCCGSGALTKVALRNNLKEIDCLDLNVKPAKINIGNNQNVNFIEKDIRKFEPKKFYDLIVLDAPQKLLPRLFKKFENLLANCHIFVLWHGSVEEIEWNIRVRDRLRKAAKKVYSFSIYGEEISIASSSKQGIKWLEKFYKKW